MFYYHWRGNSRRFHGALDRRACTTLRAPRCVGVWRRLRHNFTRVQEPQPRITLWATAVRRDPWTSLLSWSSHCGSKGSCCSQLVISAFPACSRIPECGDHPPARPLQSTLPHSTLQSNPKEEPFRAEMFKFGPISMQVWLSQGLSSKPTNRHTHHTTEWFKISFPKYHCFSKGTAIEGASVRRSIKSVVIWQR